MKDGIQGDHSLYHARFTLHRDYVPVILMVLLIRSVTLLIALSSSTVELELE